MTEQRRERSFSFGSLDLTIGVPEKAAESISRSLLYRHLIRPVGRRIDKPPEPDAATGDSIQANPWTLRDVLAHPDGFLRHRRLSDLIKQRYRSGTVLSVGDPFLELRDYLQSFDVTCTDIIEPYLPVPADATFVQADFRRAESHFADGSFDLVASNDVLEHIPPGDRSRFIEQCVRVARKEILIAFPGGSHARRIENLILRSPLHTFRGALLEHAEQGLPEPLDVAAMLRDCGLETELRPLTTINEWLTSFVLDPFSAPEVDLFRDYCSFLNGTAGGPSAGPYYRYVVIGTKPPTTTQEVLS